jgi:hypothetical protein
MSYLTNFDDKKAEAIQALETLQLLAPLRDFNTYEDLINNLKNI